MKAYRLFVKEAGLTALFRDTDSTLDVASFVRQTSRLELPQLLDEEETSWPKLWQLHLQPKLSHIFAFASVLLTIECVAYIDVEEDAVLLTEVPPDLNHLFRHANSHIFNQNLTPKKDVFFPCSSRCAGFRQVSGAVRDHVCYPIRFKTMAEYLVAMNHAGHIFDEFYHKSDKSKFSIRVYPHDMTKKQEDSMKKGWKGFVDSMGYITRVTDEDMVAIKNLEIEKHFPFCSRAFHSNSQVWFCLRQGKLLVCEGRGDGGRGTAERILKEVPSNATNLHALLCDMETAMTAITKQRAMDDLDQVTRMEAREMESASMAITKPKTQAKIEQALIPVRGVGGGRIGAVMAISAALVTGLCYASDVLVRIMFVAMALISSGTALTGLWLYDKLTSYTF